MVIFPTIFTGLNPPTFPPPAATASLHGWSLDVFIPPNWPHNFSIPPATQLQLTAKEEAKPSYRYHSGKVMWREQEARRWSRCGCFSSPFQLLYSFFSLPLTIQLLLRSLSRSPFHPVLPFFPSFRARTLTHPLSHSLSHSLIPPRCPPSPPPSPRQSLLPPSRPPSASHQPIYIPLLSSSPSNYYRAYTCGILITIGKRLFVHSFTNCLFSICYFCLFTLCRSFYPSPDRNKYIPQLSFPSCLFFSLPFSSFAPPPHPHPQARA